MTIRYMTYILQNTRDVGVCDLSVILQLRFKRILEFLLANTSLHAGKYCYIRGCATRVCSLFTSITQLSNNKYYFINSQIDCRGVQSSILFGLDAGSLAGEFSTSNFSWYPLASKSIPYLLWRHSSAFDSAIVSNVLNKYW